MKSDTGLQLERTSLAWRRTGLVAVAATFALARAAVVRGVPSVAALCGALAVVAASTLWEGTAAHAEKEGDMSGPGPGPVLPLAAFTTVAVTVVLAGAGVALLVLS